MLSAVANTAPAVSVIVPVWNVESYIGRCIESLQEQTLKDIEIIFVDDCGNDDSMRLVEKAAEQDLRIRIVHNEQNLGSGPSRNAGIEAARGEYLSFVDPDDWVAPNFLELLYTKVRAEDLDIVKGACLTIHHGNSVENAVRSPKNEWMRQELQNGFSLYTQFTYEHTTAIYRRELITRYDIRYGEARKAEDDVFLLKVCYFAQSFAFEDEALYYYVHREGSLVQTYSSTVMKTQLVSFADQLAFLESHDQVGRNATIFLNGKLESELRLLLTFSIQPGMAEQADELLKELQAMLNSSGYRELLAKESRYAYALLAFGANLVDGPADLIDKQMEVSGYLQVASNWVDYICSHPDERKSCEPEFVETALALQSYAQTIDTQTDAQAYLRELDTRLNQPPPHTHSTCKLGCGSFAPTLKHERARSLMAKTQTKALYAI